MCIRKTLRGTARFFAEVLGFRSVDAGHGWLIFSLPHTEAAFHPSDENGVHELYFICENLQDELASLAKKGVACDESPDCLWVAE